NPDSVTQTVYLNVGDTSCDIYDAVSKTRIATGVTGNTPIQLSSNSAVVAVVIPAGGVMTSESNSSKVLVNGIVVDYQGTVPANYPPRIKSLAVANSTVTYGDTTRVYCTAADNDHDSLTYAWSSLHG
ncbi:MAG TPA: hypothetical protein PL001_12355, partial [Candidatus Kryptobacter bacterium]|nr:hypothetical protein [Candidatus Kryptobacter bacterium]